MSSSLRNDATGAVTYVALVANLVFWGTPFIFLALVKPFLFGGLRRRWVLLLSLVADCWVAGNGAILDVMLETRWEVRGLEGLSKEERYLVIANHRSAVDVFVLFKVLDRAPFIRFFLKRALLWIPIAGFACWALDFPFMHRYSHEWLERHPEKRGIDLKTVRRSCRRYRRLPVTILTFLEGTRFTHAKQQAQQSPWRHLLRPRFGGLSYAVATVGRDVAGLIDLTLAYPGAEVTLWRFLSNRVPVVVIDASSHAIPARFCDDAITRPGPEREEFRSWVLERWDAKDRALDAILRPHSKLLRWRVDVRGLDAERNAEQPVDDQEDRPDREERHRVGEHQ